MKHMVIHLCKEFHGFAAVAPQHRIVEYKHSAPALAGKLSQSNCYPNGQKQEELLPIEGRVAKETVIGILGNSMVVMLRFQGTEQILPWKTSMTRRWNISRAERPQPLRILAL